MSVEDELELDKAMAASIAWHEAEEARRRRAAATSYDNVSNDTGPPRRSDGAAAVVEANLEQCYGCGQPFLDGWEQCQACGANLNQHRYCEHQEQQHQDSRGVDSDLDAAIAMSLQEQGGGGTHLLPPPPPLAAAVLASPSQQSASPISRRRRRSPSPASPSLDAALAESLSSLWECNGCSALNAPAALRCLMCGVYVRAEAAEAAQLELELDLVTACGASALSGSSSGGGSTGGGSGSQEARCGLPGCGVRDTSAFGFCCRLHRDRASAKGLLAPSSPHVERVFAGPDGTWSAHVLTRSHPARQPLIDQFLGAWRKEHYESGSSSGSSQGLRVVRPHVQRVLALRPPPDIIARFADHLAGVGGARRLFHGTSLGCGFGVDAASPPCDGGSRSGACAVCSICRNGFALNRAGSQAGRAMNLRFGKGLYFSSTSGKSHDYASGSEKWRPDGSGRDKAWFVMLVCQVAVGRTHTTQEARLPQDEIDELLASGDDRGSAVDSVTGEVGPNLNFDEVVTYNEASAIPAFLLAYNMS